MVSITIEERYHGPPDSGHGGYSSGVIALLVPADTVEVALHAPVPLDSPLAAEAAGDVLQVSHGTTPIAEARRSDTDITADVPEAVSYHEAAIATISYVGYKSHPTPTCLVCGIQREAGDGMRIFPGTMKGKNMVAAPWVPEVWLTGDDGGVRTELIWAALDCPGGWALTDFVPGKLARLGTMTARVLRGIEAGERYTVAGWALGAEGKKLYCGTAIFDYDGELCAAARSTWVKTDA